MFSSEMELVVLEDMEFERVCTPWSYPCDRKAEWLYVKACCGLELPFCEPHASAADEQIGKLNATGGPVDCHACKAETDSADGTWVKL